jgi:hypothetical protein
MIDDETALRVDDETSPIGTSGIWSAAIPPPLQTVGGMGVYSGWGVGLNPRFVLLMSALRGFPEYVPCEIIYEGMRVR